MRTLTTAMLRTTMVLVTLAVAMVVVTLAAAMVILMARRAMRDEMAITATARKGGESVVVDLLPPANLPQGGHLATNPTVGIGARQMPPGRVVGSVRSRAPLARIPPIPALRVGGNGLMKGTPGNTCLVVCDGGAVGVVTLLLLAPTRIQILSPVFVVWGRGLHTHVVSAVNVTTTRVGERQGRRFGLESLLTHVPSDAPNTVRVNVTAIMADTVVIIPMMVTLESGAAASSGCCPIAVSEGVTGASVGVGVSGGVRVAGGRVGAEEGELPRTNDPAAEDDTALRRGGPVGLPIDPVVKWTVSWRMARPRCRAAGKPSTSSHDTGTKAPNAAGMGQAAASDAPACRNEPKPRGRETRVGQRVGETHDEAQRAPAHADR